MKTNVQITASKKEFKNGQSGYEVKVDGMEGKLDCKMNFTSPLKAMRYMFLLSKRLELQVDTIQVAALSLAYQRAKEAEQKAVEDAAQAANEVAQEAEQEQEDAPAPKGENAESPKSLFQDEEQSPSPILKQFDELKAKHPDAVLLFRCGDFYESYKEDAEAIAEILGITLTRRNDENISMAGFPYHALDTYLPKLIRAGKRVAICDQLEDKKPSKKRSVSEIITPSDNNTEGAK